MKISDFNKYYLSNPTLTILHPFQFYIKKHQREVNLTKL